MMRALVLAGALALIAGCSGVPRRPVISDTVATAVQAQREAILAGYAQWELTGRIAVSDGRDGGSGRIEWIQDGPQYQITLNAPVTRRSWRLIGAPGFARLEGLEGGPFDGHDAEQLLREHLGWNVPLVDLAAWVRGLRAGPTGRIEFQPSGLPGLIEQHDWRIEYRQFDQVDGLAMPQRVFASRGPQRIRLQVDAWEFPAGE